MKDFEYTQLTPLQLDALKEVGNIGSGNAATAFSQMLNNRVDITVPTVSVLDLNMVPELIGGPEIEVAGIYLKMMGAASGNILFILPTENAKNLIKAIAPSFFIQDEGYSELEQSVLCEIGNIISSSYLNALSQMTSMTLINSVPAFACDMAGAILSVILAEIGIKGDYALVIETNFLSAVLKEEKKGFFFLIPEPETLIKILTVLGVIDDESQG